MLYLILAIASSVMVSVCMRFSERYVKHEMGMFTANYIVCMLLSYLYMDHEKAYLNEEGLGVLFVLGIISGVLYLISFVFLKLNMKHNGIVMSSTFMKLGVLIPTIMAVVVFHEVPGIMQIAGIVLAVLAIIIVHFEKDALQESNKKSWLLVLLVLSGLGDSMANIFEQVGNPAFKDAYLLLTFGSAFVIALFLGVREKKKVSWKDILCGMVIGIPNYYSSRFLLLALGSLEAVLVYPVYSVGTMVMIILAGIVVFREKLSKKKAAALVMIAAALCFMNL